MTLADWLTLPDADLEANLGPLSDWLKERCDPRGKTVAMSWLYQARGRWHVYSDADPVGSASVTSKDRTVVARWLADAIRKLFVGCESCGGKGRRRNGVALGRWPSCSRCSGRGWLLPGA